MPRGNVIRTALITLMLIGMIPVGRAAQLLVMVTEQTDYPLVYTEWAVEQGHQINVQRLTRVDTIESRIKVPHNGDEAQAEGEIKAMLTPAVEQEFVDAWRQAMLIKRFEIDQLPAIIINEQAVYYGLNPRLALEAYHSRVGGN